MASGVASPAEELEIEAFDGSRRVILASGAVVYGEDAKVLGAIGVHVDVTARREMEDELQGAQKMEVVGQLASGIAHEFNSLLTGIHARAEFQLDGLAETDAGWSDANEIRLAAVRAAALTRRLVALGQREIVQVRTLDLNNEIDEAMPGMQALLPREVALTFSSRGGPAWIRADRHQIEQVLMNLVMNSRDAISHAGTIAIQTRLVHVTQVSGESPVPPGHYVECSVADTGRGMDHETQRQAFDPFFNARPSGAEVGVGVGAGLGLGLSTVRSIVSRYGGSVSIESSPGAGTRMVVLLPITHEEALPALPQRTRTPGAPETILVVEDQDDVRLVIRRVLEKHGVRVLTAASGGEALEIFGSADGAVSLVITDVIMPGMSGLELAPQLRALSPSLPIIFISGYTEDEILRQGILPNNSRFLKKPFTNKSLTDKVEEALSGSAFALPAN